MAIYHLSVRTISRAKGKRSGLKRDYITREGRYKKDGDEVLYKESGNLPSWAKTDETFWKGADRYERANARLGIEVEVALPKELNDEAKIILAKRMRTEVVKNKYPYSMAIHKGVKTKGGNPHIHLIFSARTIDGIDRSKEEFFRRANLRQPEKGGAPKDRSITKKSWLKGLRKDWAELANDQLEREGRAQRVSHKSLKDQGVDKIPGRHIGPSVLKMETRGIKTEHGARVVEAKLQAQTHEELLKRLKEVQLQIAKQTRVPLRER